MPKAFYRSCGPATQKMLYGVTDQFQDEFTAVRHELAAVRENLQSEITVVRHELTATRDSLKSEIMAMRHEIKADIALVAAQVHRFGILAEEQNAKNSIVLDGLTSLFHRQDRVEAEMVDVKKTLASFTGR